MAVTDASGTLISQQRYLPFGGVRADVPSANVPSTDYGYTGQRNLDAEIGLMDYKARFYSPYLNRFVQPDSLIPGPVNPQSWNRFSYVFNNPIRFNDPTGHMYREDGKGCDGSNKVGERSLSSRVKTSSAFFTAFCLSENAKSREVILTRVLSPGIDNTKRNAAVSNNKRSNRGDSSISQGTIYASMDDVTTNGNIQRDLWLASKAEEGWDGWTGSGTIPQLDLMTDVGDYLDGIQYIEDMHSETDFYNINIEINWELTASGVTIQNLQVNNYSPTVAAVDRIIFSFTSHGPNDYRPNDVAIYGSPNNYAGSNGSLDMNVGVVLPRNQQDVMIVQLRLPGALPEGPFMGININPNNLHAGCSFPLPTK